MLRAHITRISVALLLLCATAAGTGVVAADTTAEPTVDETASIAAPDGIVVFEDERWENPGDCAGGSIFGGGCPYA